MHRKMRVKMVQLERRGAGAMMRTTAMVSKRKGMGDGGNNATSENQRPGKQTRMSQEAPTANRSEMPIQPSALGASNPGSSTFSVAELHAEILELKAERDMLRPPGKRGRNSKKLAKVLRELEEKECLLASLAPPIIETGAGMANPPPPIIEAAADMAAASAPLSSPGDNLHQQQQHDWPPEEPQVLHHDPEPKEDPWLSWFPKEFSTSMFSSIQSTCVFPAAEEQRPLVYGCSWPVYTIHRFYRSEMKRVRGRRNLPTVQNTRDPMKTRPQAQANEREMPGPEVLQGNVDQQGLAGGQGNGFVPQQDTLGHLEYDARQGNASKSEVVSQQCMGGQGNATNVGFREDGWCSNSLYPHYNYQQGDAVQANMPDLQNFLGSNNDFLPPLPPLFPRQYEAGNAEVVSQPDLLMQGNAMTTRQDDALHFNALDTQYDADALQNVLEQIESDDRHESVVRQGDAANAEVVSQPADLLGQGNARNTGQEDIGHSSGLNTQLWDV